jgi:hypothetical protein
MHWKLLKVVDFARFCTIFGCFFMSRGIFRNFWTDFGQNLISLPFRLTGNSCNKGRAWRQKCKNQARLLFLPPPKSLEIHAKLVDRSNSIARSCGGIWPNLRASIINRIHTLRLWLTITCIHLLILLTNTIVNSICYISPILISDNTFMNIYNPLHLQASSHDQLREFFMVLATDGDSWWFYTWSALVASLGRCSKFLA